MPFRSAAIAALATIVVAGCVGEAGGGPIDSTDATPIVVPSEPPAGLGATPTAPPSCPVTRPDPPFVPPSGYPETPPAAYRAAWFGSAALWTMLDLGGDVWSDLPESEAGLTQKTFWWSVDFREPEPAIGVTGERLDGPGSFEAGNPGTNAEADFGRAMLVGVEVPEPGCWRLTADYRDASLSYVVWVAPSGGG